MHTLGDMAKALNRSPVYLQGVQARFELPTMVGSGYPEAYLSFLRTVVFLRMLNVSEESLRDLWHIEKKLLQLLHVDSTGSSTWFLDSCGASTHPERRLLLSNHDLGVPLTDSEIQTGLNFADSLPELFGGKEMGEDALRVLGDYLKLQTRIQTDVTAEVPLVRAADEMTTDSAFGHDPATSHALNAYGRRFVVPQNPPASVVPSWCSRTSRKKMSTKSKNVRSLSELLGSHGLGRTPPAP